MEINDISYKVRGAIYEVHKELGPGLLESVYHAALMIELSQLALKVEKEVGLYPVYKNHFLDLGFRMDIVVEDQLVIELKSVEILHPIHKKQLLNYLKISKKKLGILVNFNCVSLEDKVSLVRIIN